VEEEVMAQFEVLY